MVAEADMVAAADTFPGFAHWRYSPHGSRIQIAQQTAAIIEDKSKRPQAVVGAWLKATQGARLFGCFTTPSCGDSKPAIQSNSRPAFPLNLCQGE